MTCLFCGAKSEDFVIKNIENSSFTSCCKYTQEVINRIFLKVYGLENIVNSCHGPGLQLTFSDDNDAYRE